jgi:uncharacterized protein YyaL (SSP411 family)
VVLVGAPKFPVTPALSFLQGEGASGNEPAAELVSRTLATYARSDLRDAVEGGFFRYSTMRDFSEPHYERMLYDNAGLLSLYSREGDRRDTAGRNCRVSADRHSWWRAGLVPPRTAKASSMASPVRAATTCWTQRRVEPAPPAVDDKVITGWNGLALRGLADAHRAGVAGRSRGS